jgi:hypothetical protein
MAKRVVLDKYVIETCPKCGNHFDKVNQVWVKKGRLKSYLNAVYLPRWCGCQGKGKK